MKDRDIHAAIRLLAAENANGGVDIAVFHGARFFRGDWLN
jgi:hypothetical protein